MALICTYCGAHGTDRDQENGRCGSCGIFYTGAETVVETPVEDPADGNVGAEEAPEPSVTGRGDEELQKPPSTESTEVELGTKQPNSEDLVKPRRLSPHFKRRIGQAWHMEDGATSESTISGQQAHRDSRPTSTLNTTSAMVDTKSAQTLSIATRRIASLGEQVDGDYQLTEVIGEGSMGKVWSARQASLDRHVAVKIPRPELAAAGSLGEGQFISEVVVTGKLEHPNIVPIYELGRDTKGTPFYAMKHVQGLAWNELIEQKSLTENLEILMKVCDAIAFAHDRNFLHRDIKPHNVMIGEFGEVSVMDWGIAVSIKEDPDQPWAALASGPAGTPAYMAPEMATHNSSELGVVSDVYLLGAVLYEIVTGLPPHPRSGDVQEALFAAAANEIVPTTESGELIDIARRAMATNVDDRYQGVPALQAALREYQSHRESVALCESANEHLAEAKRQNNSDQFARARFGFEEALKLWPENLRAQSGLQVATIEYATNALRLENYELGISILDAENPKHRDLLTKLEQKRASRKRLATFSKLAAGTAIAAVLSVVAVIIFKNRELDQERQEAVAARNDAVDARNEAVDAQAKAVTEAERARAAEQQARKSRDAAVVAKVEARNAADNARREKRNAELASYSSDIGLAAESIGRNAFNKATSILARIAPEKDARPEDISIRAKLRHIEWGLLKDASNPRPVRDFLISQQVETVASSIAGDVLAAGSKTGSISLWQDPEGSDPFSQKATTLKFGEELNSIAVSHDGRYLAAAGRVGNAGNSNFAIKLWDLKSQSQPTDFIELTGHTDEVLSVTFSRDARCLLSSGSDRRAIVWDRRSGEAIAVARDHLDRRVWTAAFSPNEQQIVTACDDGRVRVWDFDEDAKRLRKQFDLRGHDGPVYSAVFCRDGTTVVSGGYDRRLLRWRLPDQPGKQHGPTADLEARLRGGATNSIPFEQIGQDFQQHEASVHEITTGEVDGHEFLLTCGNDNTIRVWNPSGDSWTANKVLRGHGRWVRGCTFSQSGNAVWSGAHDGAKWWDWRAYSMPRELYPIAERRFGKEPSELGMSAATRSIYSPDGRWVATSYENGTVAVWDLKSGDRSASQLLVDGHALLAATGKFYKNGRRLLTSAGDNTTRLWDVHRGTQLTRLRGTGWRGSADVASFGSEKTLVVSGSDDRLTPAYLWTIDAEGDVRRTPLLSDVTASFLQSQLDRTSSDLQSGVSPERIEQLKRQIPDVTVVRFAKSGRRFLVGDSSGRCFLFELGQNGSPKMVADYAAHGTEVRDLVFILDDQQFMTAGVDGQIRRWSCDDTGMLEQLKWSGPVTSLAVAENGHKVLVGHAPMESKDYSVVELFEASENSCRLIGRLPMASDDGSRDWSSSRPTVQSVEFADNRALVSLYFPAVKTKATARATAPTGYQIGYWDWAKESKFQTIETGRSSGEVASARFVRKPKSGDEILLVGGKGARLLASSGERPFDFKRLKASFRPSTSLTALDFSRASDGGESRRLVVGDSEGNIRLWELSNGRWSETAGAASQLAGHHQDAIVASRFDPASESRLLTIDRRGQWRAWEFTKTWDVIQSGTAPTSLGQINTSCFSPDGKRIFVGGENGAVMLSKQEEVFTGAEDAWQTGRVFSATFSPDGAWVATSDRENRVLIWSVDGESIATMKAEDAKGVATMVFSDDRRRLVTGHDDKRIVVWDTAALVDPLTADANLNPVANKIHELLTLEEHRRGVTSVCLSPNGRSLLTSGEEGRTIVWSGQPIEPISISNSSDRLSYRPGRESIAIDRAVIISDPSHLVQFDGAELNVQVDSVTDREDLTLSGVPTSSGRSVQIILDEDGTRLLGLKKFPLADPVVVGKIISSKATPNQITIRFNDKADVMSVQAVLRSLAYRVDIPRGSGENDSIIREVALSGGAIEDVSESRRIRVSLRGLTRRSSKESVSSAEAQLLQPLRSTITVELDEAGSETQLNSPDQT